MTLCPGPGRANECSARACRYGGCQGRMPEPTSQNAASDDAGNGDTPEPVTAASLVILALSTGILFAAAVTA